jgi:hypothetical protein
MDAVALFALLVYGFGAFTYGTILVLWIRELGRVGWATRPEKRIDLVNGALVILSFVWFCALIVQVVVALAGPPRPFWPIETAVILLAYLFPPLIMHITWADEATSQRPKAPGRAWRSLIVAAYVAAISIPLISLRLMFDPATSTPTYLNASRVLGTGLSALFILTAIFCLVLVSRGPKRPRARERRQTWAMAALFGMMMLLFAAILAVGEISGGRHGGHPFIGSLLEVLPKSLPLVFVFVSTYFESRFAFFDIFVKRGFALLVAMAILVVWFSFALPLLAPRASGPAAAWLFALAVLPLLALAPWVYARVSRALDRRWLGRPYSTVEAVTRVLAALRSATSEPEAIARAEEALADIFRAPVMVLSGVEPGPAPFAVAREAAIRCTQGPPMRLLLGPRAGDVPYFSQDLVLVRSLADVFASVLDNLRLQERRHVEEQRTHELSLIASQAELKALRAQINPHFLFNALNAIAGLLHRDPATADRTIERLADVFRYTLRRSNSEWAILDDEIEFVRAYLEVERARFGDRLEIDIQVSSDVRTERVPTMMLQTLVENAVKHGVSAVPGRARLKIDVRERNGRVVMSVSDNGPRFDAGSAAGDSGGYGLANIRQRLAGYFGQAATLEFSRDDRNGETRVTVSLPLAPKAPVRASGATR